MSFQPLSKNVALSSLQHLINKHLIDAYIIDLNLYEQRLEVVYHACIRSLKHGLLFLDTSIVHYVITYWFVVFRFFGKILILCMRNLCNTVKLYRQDENNVTNNIKAIL